MADQYENAPLTDFDVVRSTQFVDDLTCGVRGYRFPHFEVAQPSCMSSSIECVSCWVRVAGVQMKGLYEQLSWLYFPCVSTGI